MEPKELLKNTEDLPQIEGIELIKDVSPKEVFEFWRQAEEDQQHWINVVKAKGLASWEEWRKPYFEAFGADKLNWGLFGIKNPLETVPNFYGGPFETWKKLFYKEKPTMTFVELTELNELWEEESTRRTIHGMRKNSPVEKAICGLVYNEKVHIIEGMRRCCTLALMAKEEDNFDAKIKIALANCGRKNIPESVGGFKKKDLLPF